MEMTELYNSRLTREAERLARRYPGAH